MLRRALLGADTIVMTGFIVQELLQGTAGPRALASLRSPSSDLPLLTPDREDHVAAAEIFTRCRRAGVQLGTIDALIVQLCRRHDVTLLTTDGDFALAARHIAFKRWR